MGLFVTGTLSCFISEALEAIIENCIAEGLSFLLLKALSVVFAISITQGARIGISLIVRKITYKDGLDKMEKLKKFLQWVKSNPKSLLATFVGCLGAIIGIVAACEVQSLPAIMIGEYNAAPLIYSVGCVICLIFNVLGISDKGFETVKEYTERIAKEAQEKTVKLIEKEAEKQIKEEQKQARIAEENKKLDDEKAAKAAEFQAQVELKKQELLNSLNKQQ